MWRSAPLVSRQVCTRWLLAGSATLAVVLAASRTRACGACAVPELWDVQNLAGELVVVTNFGLLSDDGDGWRVTCEEIFGGLLLDATGDSSEGWVSTDVGPFRRAGSACDWTPDAAPQHAVWAWKFALAGGEAEPATRFLLVIDSETQALHVERARADEDYTVVRSFESTSGFRDLKAGGQPASVFLAGFGAGPDRLWQVAFSLDAGDHWETVVPDVPRDINWKLRFVDPLFPQAVLVEAEPVSGDAEGLWRFDAETGVMTELLRLSAGEELSGLSVLGNAVWVAGRSEAQGSLYSSDRREFEFNRVVSGAPPFACLGAHSGALYACVNDFTYTSSFLLGRSHDEGRTWQPLLTVEDLGTIAGCAPACDRTLDWLTAAFGSAGAPGAGPAAAGGAGQPADAGAAGAPASLPEPAEAPSGCGCRFGGSPSSQVPALSVAAMLVCLGLAVSRRRRSRETPLRHWVLLTALAPVALAGCSEAQSDGAAAVSPCAGQGDDLGGLRLTSGELVLSVLETFPVPPGVGDNEWIVLLRDTSQQPVTGLAESLVVTPFMPEHGHGTPTAVGVAEVDAGEYRLGPVNTFMPGLWRIRLLVNRAPEPRLFEFNVCVE